MRESGFANPLPFGPEVRVDGMLQEPVCGAREAGDDHAEGYTTCEADQGALGGLGMSNVDGRIA